MPPDVVNLGSLTRLMHSRSSWEPSSVFPSNQKWADEVERILCFLEVQGVLDVFLPRLCARETERDGALAEARMGFFFARNGFDILRWEPEEVLNRPGDLDIQWGDTEPIFVEVKGPGWQGELSQEARKRGRLKHQKYINAEARFVDPIERVEYAIKKALPKFASGRINVVAVVDDLFFSPTEMPAVILNGRLTRFLADPLYRIVAGVFLMNAVSYVYRSDVEYPSHFVPNENALKRLPDAVAAGFLASNTLP
jgi:hypothetical protein